MVGEILIMSAGLISFPIFTRIFTKEEYGVMSLVLMSIVIAELLFNFGLRHATQRFSSFYEKQGQYTLFYSTVLWTSLVLGLLGTIFTFAMGQVLTSSEIISSSIGLAVSVSSFLIIIRILTQVLGSLFRAKGQAKEYVIFAVFTKYLGMTLAVVFVLFFHMEVQGFFLGLVIGEAIVLIPFCYYTIKKISFPLFSCSIPMLKTMVLYGFPLVIVSLSSVILSSGDRYIIAYFSTTAHVAAYIVPYNLCLYVQDIIISSLQYAVIPLLVNEWEKNGALRIPQKISNVIKLYCLISLPVLFGLCAVGEEVILFLATEKYTESSYLIPYIAIGILFQGLITPLTLPLLLYKKTTTLLKITLAVALANIILNLIFVPRFGLLGAAVSTFICYGALVIVGAYLSNKLIEIKMPWTDIIKYILCAALMYFVVKEFGLGYLDLNLFLLILLGGTVYLCLLISIDTQVRTIISNKLSILWKTP